MLSEVRLYGSCRGLLGAEGPERSRTRRRMVSAPQLPCSRKFRLHGNSNRVKKALSVRKELCSFSLLVLADCRRRRSQRSVHHDQHHDAARHERSPAAHDRHSRWLERCRRRLHGDALILDRALTSTLVGTRRLDDYRQSSKPSFSGHTIQPPLDHIGFVTRTHYTLC